MALLIAVAFTTALLAPPVVTGHAVPFQGEELRHGKETTETSWGDTSIKADDDQSTQGIRTLSPSTWTPVIVVILFIVVCLLIGAPSIISKHINKKYATDLVMKQRKLTVILPPEPGFIKLEQNHSVI